MYGPGSSFRVLVYGLRWRALGFPAVALQKAPTRYLRKEKFGNPNPSINQNPMRQNLLRVLDPKSGGPGLPRFSCCIGLWDFWGRLGPASRIA